MAVESFNGRCYSARPRILILIVMFSICNQIVYCQENAQTRIPNSLTECYENPEIYERDYRLPATMSTIIELIRKIEDTPEFSSDIRKVVISLLHRFRLDGIEHAQGTWARDVLPFSPSGYQFSKHRLLLSRLIPGNAIDFPNNTLSAVERCALHFLMSSSIETQVRGDELTRCGQLPQFRSNRLSHPFTTRNKRHSYMPASNYLCDVEMMSEMYDQRRCQRESYRRHRTTTQPVTEEDDYYNGDDDDELTPDPEPDNQSGSQYGRGGYVNVAAKSKSDCPIENGVVRTSWGAVAVGPLLAGIAAGIEQQNVATRDLLILTRKYQQRYNNKNRQVQLSVDNRWAATLAGDLSELTLMQGPSNQVTKPIASGGSGAWNSTTVPHWYFLSRPERNEMTDAEIRGGIDGLLLAMHLNEWKQQTSQLRLSQLLDMYYSHRGVLSSNIKSCDRRELFKKHIHPNQLNAQTIAFSTVLDREIQLLVTIKSEAIPNFAIKATESLVKYVENDLNDVTCDASLAANPSSQLRVATDLHIFIDASWQFNDLQPALAMLLENMDINRYGTRVTLYNANDGLNILNRTSSLNDFNMLWNQTVHQSQTTGLNLATVVRQLFVIGKELLNEEHSKSSLSGRSFVALVIPQMAGVNDADSNYAVEQLVWLRETQPDLNLLFWSGGSPGRFARFVADQRRDIFQLMSVSSSGTDNSQQISSYALPVIQRIKTIPRRIANPRCDENWNQNDWGGNAVDQYVEPSGVSFYRVHPNYYFRSGGSIRIKGQSQSQVAVCWSRSVENPRQSNTTQPTENVNCRQLATSDPYDIDLSGACEGHFLIQNCPPIYFSVEGVNRTQSSFLCSEPECRSPDSIKFSINIDNLGCYSHASMNIGQLAILVFSIVISISLSSI